MASSAGWRMHKNVIKSRARFCGDTGEGHDRGKDPQEPHVLAG